MKISSSFAAAIAAVATMGVGLSLVVDALAQDAAKKPAAAAKTTSACKGLAEAACKAQTATCSWIAPKTGKQKPYCRAKPAKKK
jgi:hypothetical protein